MMPALLTIGMIIGFLLLCYLAGYCIGVLTGIMDNDTISKKIIIGGVGFFALVLTFTIGSAIIGIYTFAVHILQ